MAGVNYSSVPQEDGMETKSIGVVALLVVSLVLVVWGALLVSGRGLRSIAGNRKATDEQIEAQKRDGLGHAIGGILIGMAAICMVELIVMYL